MSPTKILLGQGCLVVSIVVGGLWTSTQWAALMLGNQPELGAPLAKVLGQPIYHPWRLYEWWYAYEAYAPQVFRKAGMLAAGSGLAGTVVAVIGSLWRARQSKLVTTYGSARWASRKELDAARLLSGSGVFLGRHGTNHLRHDGPEHVLAFAPTRSGKGVGLVIPTLLTWPHSAVIHDIKGENWQLTSGFRSSFSTCLQFNPADPKSARYNPLIEVRKGEWEVRDVQNIADILVDPEGALERRNHWEKTSHSLLVGVILHVLYAEADKSLARVASFLSDPTRSIERTLKVMMATNHLGTDKEPVVHPVVASVARELLNKSENERSGVLSTAMSFLGLYRDPVVARNTGSCDWRPLSRGASRRFVAHQATGTTDPQSNWSATDGNTGKPEWPEAAQAAFNAG
jgi:type IV secretion system protein VirD4